MVTEKAMEGRYVLAKRDPVLQPESVRSYEPILTEGHTIQLCALQVGGHNADFDGDSANCFILLKKNDHIDKIHLKDIPNHYKFKFIKSTVKENGIKVSHYEPEEELFTKAIDPNTGNIDYKRILDYSIHENLEMYKIHDPENRFEDFWASADHSLIIYDEIDQEIKKISPKELLENPSGKYLIKNKEEI